MWFKRDISNISNDPAGRTLNKSVAISVWGKWAQNPAGQSSLKTCSTLKEYHDSLMTGGVKRITLLSDNILQVERNNDRNIDGENRKVNNNRSELSGRNTEVGAFVIAATQDLMYSGFLSKLASDQMLYMDTDSLMYFYDSKNPLHIKLPTSDMLGDLKDEYKELLLNNPNWYVKEFIAFGPKMYEIVMSDKLNGEIVRWDKTMKGNSSKEHWQCQVYSSIGTRNLLLYHVTIWKC